MFRNHLITAWRTLLKNKTYSFINILGLAVGLLSCLFIALYIQHESSYDKFFDDSERIYRVALDRIYPERVRTFASSPVTLAPTFLENYPEVESATRMHRLFFNPEINVQIGEKNFVETRYLFADSNFFKVFSFHFIEGNPETALDGPNKVVLTVETAEKYFGSGPALDKTYQDGNVENIVSGVVEALPENAHFHFDLIGSIHSLPFIQNSINSGSWINPWVYTYVKLRAGENPDVFESKFPQMVQTYGQGNLTTTLGPEYETLGHRLDFFLQPLQRIHLHSNLDIEVEPTSNISYLYLLAVVAIFILLLSCINFVNLSTVRSTERGKEVGIRKVLGSRQSDLIRQFIFESIATCMISLVIALGIAHFLAQPFNQLLNQNLNFWSFFTPANSLIILGVIIGVGIIAGLYPAIIISSVDSADVLKGQYKSSGRGRWIRNSLIVFQFFITITMISGAFFVGEQMQYMESKDLGFDKEQVLVIRQSQTLGQDYTAFKNELLQTPEVLGVGGSIAMPGDFMGSNIFRPLQTGFSDLRANTVTYDDNFIQTMGYELESGRPFSEEFDDSNAIIVNESAAREMGFENAVGMQIRITNAPDTVPPLNIVGILKDFHFTSLHSPISPIVIFNGGQNFVPACIAVRTQPVQSYSALHAGIEANWTQFSPDQPVRISHLTEELNHLYQADRRSAKVFQFFTYVAIIIAFVGLFSLASYVIQMRTKEISMRKVLGASIYQIFGLLSRNFITLVLGALLLSVPASYYAAQSWLSQFAYRIQIDWWVFIQSGIVAIVLVLAAISYQSVRIYMLNPGDTLKVD